MKKCKAAVESQDMSILILLRSFFSSGLELQMEAMTAELNILHIHRDSRIIPHTDGKNQ